MNLGGRLRGLAFAGAVVTLPSPAGPGAGQPFLTPYPFGNGIVALSWLEPRAEGGHRLRLATLGEDLREWSVPTTIAEGDSFFVNWADFPSVAFVGTPREPTVVAHWLWKVGAGTYAYQVRLALASRGGSAFSAPIVPHRDTTATEHGFVSLAPEGNGFRAIWLDGRNTGGEPPGPMTLRTANVHVDGMLSDERELDDRVCDCCATAVARTNRGLVVAYRDRSEEEVRDISVVRLVDGAWSAPRAVSRDGWKIAGCPVNGPALAAHGDRVTLAWFTAARDSPRVFIRVSEDGGATFGPAERMSAGSAVGRVDLASTRDGGVVVSWMEREEKGDGVKLVHRVRTAAGAWRPRRVVASLSGARSSGVPQVVVSGDRVVYAFTEAGKPSRIRLGSYALASGGD
jgi:hypothetical protein